MSFGVDMALRRWKPKPTIKSMQGKRYVRAFLKDKGYHKKGGFFISAALARELSETFGPKAFVEIYYGFDEDDRAVIVFEFNDESGYKVPFGYSGIIHAKSLVSFLGISRKYSEDLKIDPINQRLYVIFEAIENEEDEVAKKEDERIMKPELDKKIKGQLAIEVTKYVMAGFPEKAREILIEKGYSEEKADEIVSNTEKVVGRIPKMFRDMAKGLF